MINGKTYKFFTGLRFKKFYNLVKDFNQKSLHSQGVHTVKSKKPKEIYFR